MTNIILSITILTAVLLQSCAAQNKHSTEAKKPTVVVNQEAAANVKTDSLNVVAQTNVANPISEVYTDYIGIKNSLTKDNPDSAAIYAKKMFKDIDKVQMEKLASTQHTAWMKYMTKLSYDAEHIKSTVELEHQREHFISLSKNMYDLLKSFNTNSSIIYYQFCPMANEGKGAYWISEQSKVINPYFGKKMLSCGSTKETIPVK